MSQYLFILSSTRCLMLLVKYSLIRWNHHRWWYRPLHKCFMLTESDLSFAVKVLKTKWKNRKDSCIRLWENSQTVELGPVRLFGRLYKNFLVSWTIFRTKAGKHSTNIILLIIMSLLVIKPSPLQGQVFWTTCRIVSFNLCNIYHSLLTVHILIVF